MPLKLRALALLKGQKQILLNAEFLRNQSREDSRSFKAKFTLCSQDYGRHSVLVLTTMAPIKILNYS